MQPKDIKIGENHQQIMPYLIVEDGTAFINFLENVFGAEELLRVKRDESGVMHAELRIGKQTIMLADATDEFQPMPAGMFIYVHDTDEVYAHALKNGAISVMPPTDQEYGRAAGVRDPFGNTWWLTSL